MGVSAAGDPHQLHANRRATVNIRLSEAGVWGWIATDDNYDGPGSPQGLGWTQYAAVNDLRDGYASSDDDDGIMACDIWLMAHREME